MVEKTIRENMGTDDGSFGGNDDDDDQVVDVEDQFSDEITGDDVQDVEDVSISPNDESETNKSVNRKSTESGMTSSNSVVMLFAKRRWIVWIALLIVVAFVLGIVIGNAVNRDMNKMKGHPPPTFGNPEFGGVADHPPPTFGNPAFSGEHTSTDQPHTNNNAHNSSIGDPSNPETTEEAQYAARKRHFTTLVVEWSGAAAVANPDDPARLALDWILDEDPFRLTTADRTMDVLQRYVMAVFYFATLGDHWPSNRKRKRLAADSMEEVKSNHADLHDSGGENHIVRPKDHDSVAYFLTFRDVCHWSTSDGKTGVFCNENGAISKLEFRDFGLGGYLPREFGYLSNLISINVEYNDIEGTIPTYFGTMMSLETIKFENNLMSGEIPKELANLKKLEKLDLDGNNFFGTLPSAIGGLERIVKIEIGGSKLTGPIPAEISNLKETIQKIDLRDNQFSGQLPSQMGSLTNLNYLDLENNKLSGAIPIEFSAAASLEMLYLNGNDLTGSLDGTFCNSNIAFFEFVADCRGDSPEVKCSCCTSCCDPQGSNCTTLIPYLEEGSVSQEAEKPTAKPWGTVDYEPTAQPAFPPVLQKPTASPGVTVGTTTVVSVQASELKTILATVSDINLLETKHTDQYKAFMWMVNVDPSPVDVESTPSSIIIQKYVMALIYVATNGKYWNDQNSYLTDARVCDWKGLTCNDDGDIISIVLEHNNLDGTIVSEIGSLGANLRKLHLGMNFLHGPLPSELGLLSGLQMLDVFDNNEITGTIPSELSIQSFPKMETIELVGTGITGNLDPLFCTADLDHSETNISANCFGQSVICSCCQVCCDAKGENCKVLANND